MRECYSIIWADYSMGVIGKQETVFTEAMAWKNSPIPSSRPISK